jgi:putative SOS response-associated peptidase YedK
MRWGLVPARIADPDSFKIFTTSNARSEGILDKPIWKGPFQHSRCLIPIDGFYEWVQHPSLPQPPPIEPGEHGLFGDFTLEPKNAAKPKAGSKPVYKFEMPDGSPYALAGLFSEWRPKRGSMHPPLDTFSILTTEANELMQPIHSRMPVVLHPRDFDRGLNDYDESRPPIDLLRPYETEGLRMTPANRLVGNVRNNGPEMLIALSRSKSTWPSPQAILPAMRTETVAEFTKRANDLFSRACPTKEDTPALNTYMQEAKCSI